MTFINYNNQFSIQQSMHSIRNTLYEIKKESQKRSSPNYLPNNEDDEIRTQNQRLRTIIRNQQTQIIRLNSQLDELKKRIMMFQLNQKKTEENEEETKENLVKQFSQIPMILENKQLKQNAEILHQQNLALNGKNLTLQASLRQSNSTIHRLQTKLTELTILQKMRQERYKDEVEKIPPIIVGEDAPREGVEEIAEIAKYIRERVVDIGFQLFLTCAKQCLNMKKVNSFQIFKGQWNQLKNQKKLGFLQLNKCYSTMRRIELSIEPEYCHLSNDFPYRDTLNEWFLQTLLQILNTPPSKQPEQRLFRLLGLLYRSKYPIKGEKYELDTDIKEYYEDKLCLQMDTLIGA